MDGDKLNNRLDNLEWVTKSENQQHEALVLGQRNGENNYNSLLTDAMVFEIYEECKNTNRTYVDIAKDYNVTGSLVSQILTGYKWKHLNLEPIRKYRPHYSRQKENKNTYKVKISE